MKRVDRANYVINRKDAYEDAPQSVLISPSYPNRSPSLIVSGFRRIGHGATISAPHMHAHASEYLLTYLQAGSKVLDVGSGSGYLTAILHHLVSPGDERPAGKVVGIDHIAELVDWSVENLKKDGLGPALESGQIEMIAGDGRKGRPTNPSHAFCNPFSPSSTGYAGAGPYDCIHVGAAAPTIPQDLIDQLAQPGRLFIPVGTGAQEIVQVDKDDRGNIQKKRLFGVMVCGPAFPARPSQLILPPVRSPDRPGDTKAIPFLKCTRQAT